ncbi:PDZ domain-containing protein [Pandoraea soli]
MSKSVATLAVILLAGCANPYQQYYSGMTPEQVVAHTGRASDVEPRLRVVSDVNVASVEMLESGYQLIGSSSFNGANPSQKMAVQQAKTLHAEVVLFTTKYTNTVTSAVPIVTPTSSTTYTNGNATAYGSGGIVNAYGNSTSTTFGTQTSYVPMSVSRFDAFASYWAKGPTPVFGFQARPTTPAERAAAGTNRGVFIVAVVRGAPMFKADIMNGDILLKIGDTAIDGTDDIKLLKRYAGQRVDVAIRRNGQEIVKSVQANSLD